MPLVYEAVNRAVFERVPKSAKRILDIGCGDGSLGKALKASRECHVTGVTFSSEEAARAGGFLDEVLTWDLNKAGLALSDKYDCIIFSHVLEHLVDPAGRLKELSRFLNGPDAVVIVALPNVLQWKNRAKLMMGTWRYTEGGIMDRTHLRFFDRYSSAELIKEAGLTLVDSISDGHFPLPKIRPLLGGIARAADRAATTVLPGVFSEQFVLIAKRQR